MLYLIVLIALALILFVYLNQNVKQHIDKVDPPKNTSVRLPVKPTNTTTEVDSDYLNIKRFCADDKCKDAYMLRALDL